MPSLPRWRGVPFRRLILRCAKPAFYCGKQRGALRASILTRYLKTGDSGLDVGIGLERRLDQAVELARLERAPPLPGNIEALHDPLGLAAGNLASDEFGLGVGQISLRVGRVGLLEVRAERAAGRAECCRDREQADKVSYEL